MPEPRIPSPPPMDWRDAFAALPQDTPPPTGWHVVAARLDARRARRRAPLWLASAAALLLAVALPWRLQWPGSGQDVPAVSPPAAVTFIFRPFFSKMPACMPT